MVALISIAFFVRDVYSIFFLIALFLFVIIAFLPPLSAHLKIITKLAQASRAIIFLNYFAFLAPFKLALGTKKLWSDNPDRND